MATFINHHKFGQESHRSATDQTAENTDLHLSENQKHFV